MASVRGILINTITNVVSIETLDGTLDGYYNALNCSCFDVVSRIIGGKEFTIYCDDEGLLKERPIISAIGWNGNPMLVGNLFICNTDHDGYAVSLSSDDIRLIQRYIRKYVDPAWLNIQRNFVVLD